MSDAQSRPNPRVVPRVIVGSVEERLKALEERRANRPDMIDNRTLYAGSPMYFYCTSCGHLAEEAPESYTWVPASLCPECSELRKLHLI